MSLPANIRAEVIDALAARVAELLEPRLVEALTIRADEHGSLVDAATLADALGVDRSWVYAHQERLRAIRLGSGPKSRLRFDLERATEAFRVEAEKDLPAKERQRLRSPASTLPKGVELIHGRSQR